MDALAMLDIYPPGVVARFAREAGVSEAQVAKIRQDFFDTLGKMSQQHAHVEQARIEIARALGEAKVDAAVIARRVDEAVKAEAEAGRIPSLRAGRRLLFSEVAVVRALVERAAARPEEAPNGGRP